MTLLPKSNSAILSHTRFTLTVLFSNIYMLLIGGSLRDPDHRDLRPRRGQVEDRHVGGRQVQEPRVRLRHAAR